MFQPTDFPKEEVHVTKKPPKTPTPSEATSPVHTPNILTHNTHEKNNTVVKNSKGHAPEEILLEASDRPHIPPIKEHLYNKPESTNNMSILIDKLAHDSHRPLPNLPI